jgi:hypothetical protein
VLLLFFSIAECALFIVDPEVHDIFIKRAGFTLIRVYRMQTTHDNAINKYSSE